VRACQPAVNSLIWTLPLLPYGLRLREKSFYPPLFYRPAGIESGIPVNIENWNGLGFYRFLSHRRETPDAVI